MDAVKSTRSVVEDVAAETSPNRAERLLGAMRQVFSHDLPNQLVVVQGLANLLEMEDKASLSPQAQEYLTRLSGAARRAGNLVRFLKQMDRLGRMHEPVETVQLAHLARELQAEVKQLYPERSLQFDVHWEEPAVRAGRRSLQQALLEILRCGIDWCTEPAPRSRLRSRRNGQNVELSLAMGPSNVADVPSSPGLPHDRPTLENCLELRLARELIATWDGSLEVAPSPSSFLVLVQARVGDS
jgi:light-regulated signal transduction histidine kinase (bacteriophytochrome)